MSKTFKISQFATNAQKEKEGAWVDAGGGLRLKIARLGNSDYEEHLRKLSKPYSRQIRMNTIENEVLETVIRKATAKYILLDWENLTDDDDKPIPYSEAKAYELLTEYRDFMKMVTELAGEVELFRQDDFKEVEGNSESD